MSRYSKSAICRNVITLHHRTELASNITSCKMHIMYARLELSVYIQEQNRVYYNKQLHFDDKNIFHHATYSR